MLLSLNLLLLVTALTLKIFFELFFVFFVMLNIHICLTELKVIFFGNIPFHTLFISIVLSIKCFCLTLELIVYFCLHSFIIISLFLLVSMLVLCFITSKGICVNLKVQIIKVLSDFFALFSQ